MVELKASRFYQAALQSGLIDEAGLEACWALVPPEKRTADAIDRRMARQAITTGRLTLWQAQQILAGRASGYRIDKYVLLDLLGRGGMGRVYLAKDVRLNRRVALKILSQERMNNPRAIARFQREGKVGAQLQHENLVRIYDEGDANGVRYLVMEYIEGKNAGHLINELGAIPWPTAARLARQVALGLDHARLKELIHRDVNPCNILVTTDGVAKLTDLGLAIDLNDTDNVTRDGATVGTFDYVAPEQARHSRSVDTRADLYSLGCTLYHMIAGRVPFPVASLPEKLYAHQLHEPEPLTDLAPGVPEGLAEVVRKMMRKLPEDRYQTPAEAALALEPYAVEAGWTATTASTPATTAETATIGSSVEARPSAADARLSPGPAPGSWAASLAAGTDAPTAPPTSGSGNGPDSSPSMTGVSVGDSFFPLDLGPEEPLLEGLKSAPRKPRAPRPDGTRRRFPLVAAGAFAALIALAALVALAIQSLSGTGVADGKEKGKEKPGPAPATGKPKPAAPGEVVLRFRDGKAEAAAGLPEAIAAASTRSGAEVILGGKAPFRLSTDRTIRVPDGGLTIRAAEGARPVLELKLKGSQPMFLVNANLRLVGLTVLVRYETPSDAPAFQVERDLILERCTLRATGPAEGSRFALAEGRKATVTGCLFDGFETSLDVQAGPGASVSLKQSIFLAPKPGDEATGRAVRVRSMFGQGAGTRLSVASCSSRAGAFLDVGNFRPDSPLEVEATGSAFLVKTLVTFEGAETATIGKEGTLRWKGREDRFHVTGGPWSGISKAPADLAAWSALVDESGSQSGPLKLAKEPPAPDSPKDAALRAEDGTPVGADPGQVGPEG